MSLARNTRALARLAAACSRGATCGAGQGLSAPSMAPLQQLISLAAYTPAQGFAASAAAAPPPPAAAAAAAATAPAGAAAAAAPASPAALQHPPVYERLPGRVDGRYAVPPKRVFAVVEVGGTQLKVTPNDVVVVEKLGDVDVNDTLRLNRVLLLGSAAETVIGRPYVPGAAVTAAVEVRCCAGRGGHGKAAGGGCRRAHVPCTTQACRLQQAEAWLQPAG